MEVAKTKKLPPCSKLCDTSLLLGDIFRLPVLLGNKKRGLSRMDYGLDEKKKRLLKRRNYLLGCHTYKSDRVLSVLWL